MWGSMHKYIQAIKLNRSYVSYAILFSECAVSVSCYYFPIVFFLKIVFIKAKCFEIIKISSRSNFFYFRSHAFILHSDTNYVFSNFHYITFFNNTVDFNNHWPSNFTIIYRLVSYNQRFKKHKLRFFLHLPVSCNLIQFHSGTTSSSWK